MHLPPDQIGPPAPCNLECGAGGAGHKTRISGCESRWSRCTSGAGGARHQNRSCPSFARSASSNRPVSEALPRPHCAVASAWAPAGERSSSPPGSHAAAGAPATEIPGSGIYQARLRQRAAAGFAAPQPQRPPSGRRRRNRGGAPLAAVMLRIASPPRNGRGRKWPARLPAPHACPMSAPAAPRERSSAHAMLGRGFRRHALGGRESRNLSWQWCQLCSGMFFTPPTPAARSFREGHSRLKPCPRSGPLLGGGMLE